MKRLMTALMIASATLTGCGTGSAPAGQQASGNITLDTALTAAEKEARVFTPEVMWKMGRIGSSSLSPDGKEVLYALTYYNMADNKGYTSLYVMPLGEPDQARQITDNSGKDNSPAWGIDPATGRTTVYFLSSRGKDSQGETTPQLWAVGSDGSGMRQLSSVAGGITGFGVSPKGDKVWYTADVKVDSVASSDIYDMPQSKALIYDDLMARHWDYWEDGAYSHIFVADLNASATDGNGLTNARDIMPGEAWDAPLAPYFDMSEIAWNNAGTALAYTCKKLTGYEYAMSTNSDIFLYTLADGSTRNLTEGMPGYDKYPVFSPDDSRLAWQSMERAGNESDKDRLFVMDLATGEKSYLTDGFDYNASNLRWSADGNTIWFIAPMQATHQICRVNLADRKIQVVTAGDHDYTGFSIAYPNAAQDGSSAACGTGAEQAVIVAEKTTLQMAPELFAVNTLDGTDTQITHINQTIYDNVDMGTVQKRWVTTTDGKQMLTWVILPPHFDSTKKYPTLLYCQGGPQSVVSQRWSYRWNFELMAAQGYIVVAPNRRGLPSFGQEWLDQISGDYSGQNIRDYLSAIDDVSREPWVDTDRRGCVGASYGGYSTFYLAGHSDHRFKAFIAHCGMFNFESFYGETEELWFPTNDLGGGYWDRAKNPTADRSYANSPHLAVNNWYAPILIITGAKDFRIPFTQSLQAFTAARAHGIPSRLVYFEDEGHQVFKPQNSLVWNKEFFGWLDKYVKQ
ncbi:S9 family peptidase [Millionella massiliensis]|uniref:S9 family peptidase n=1 Tax=Millionella massiliensis TaxID=1871023 RepID=UPI0008D9457E|nr:S9 family peptidase [Millionella massiliensis]